MKTEIEIPEGYEIDKLTFKKIEKKLPKTWEELGTVKGYYINSDSDIHKANSPCIPCNKNVFPKKELAEASLAMAQLLQLRDAYNNGWVVDWSENTYKYCLQLYKNKIVTSDWTFSNKVMNFKTAELRDLFLENFKDLLEIAKPLL